MYWRGASVAQPVCALDAVPPVFRAQHAFHTDVRRHHISRGVQPGRNQAGRRVFARTTAEVESSVETVNEIPEFDWHKHWWPVQFVFNLDTDRPNRVQLLGEFFVAWKGKEGDWVVMKDMCPHRLAPLSEGEPEGSDDVVCQLVSAGRVEDDGTLMCSYHGWRFNECGKCVKIPQSDDQRSHETACNSQRSAATVYPSKSRGGILWMWPDVSEGAFESAMSTSVALPDDCADYLERSISQGIRKGFTRILPYDYEFLVENVVDPAHLPFSHHGTAPNVTRSEGKGIEMRHADPRLPNTTISANYCISTGQDVNAKPTGGTNVELIDHCLVRFEFKVPDTIMSNGQMLVLATPLESGKSRICFNMIPAGGLSGTPVKRSFLVKLLDKAPPFVDHLSRNTILDGDGVFLHMQEKNAKSFGQNGHGTGNYFMPTASDYLVSKFKKWFYTEGKGGPFAGQSPRRSSPVSRRELLDRYTQHTAECKECQKALSFFEFVAAAAGLLLRASLAGLGLALLRSMQSGALMKWTAGATLVAAGFFFFVEKFVREKVLPLFRFVDYVHAEKN